MYKTIFGALTGAALIAGPALAADMPAKAPAAAPAESCRLPGAAQDKFAFECMGLSLSVGAMYIKRQTTHGVVVTPPTGTPGTIVTGDNLGFGWSWSPEIIGRFRFGGGWSLEGRYFYSRPDDAVYHIPTINTFRIAGIGVTILGGGQLHTTYQSHLSSLELNVAKELLPNISVLAGYRRLHLQENLNVIMATPATFANWADKSTLDGAQVGVNLGYVTPVIPLHLNAVLKAGAYNNASSNQFTSTIVSRSGGTGSKTAYSGEVNVTAAYYITDRWSVQASWMGLWLRNVALADAAASTTIQVAGGTSSPVNLTHVWYNAASFRLGYDF